MSTDHFKVLFKSNKKKPPFFEGSKALVLTYLSEKPETLTRHWVVYDEENDRYYSAVVFMMMAQVDIAQTSVPHIVDKFYAMDPDTDEFLPDGKHLKNGLCVLIEDSNKRASTNDMAQDWGWDRALKENRWCTVTELKFLVSDTHIQFIGVYEDGTKRVRKHMMDEPWLAKISSENNAEVESSKRYIDMFAVVLEELEKLDEQACWNCNVEGPRPQIDIVADQITKKILGIR